MASLVDRVKNIIVAPRTEWPRIAEEPATVGSLYTGYIMILAAIGPIALAIHMAMIGLGLGIGILVVGYLIALGVTYLLALIADALAPTFNGQKNLVQSLKLVAYSYTPAWVAGVFNLFGGVGRVLAFIAMIYGFYLFYLGAPVVKGVATEKSVAYTIIVVVCAIVLFLLLSSLLMGMLFGGAMLGTMGMMR